MRWTDAINDEWSGHLLKNKPDLDPKRISATIHAMNTSVLDAIVRDYEPLINGLDLPDPDDRHVLAAAIMARAHVIVTFNLKDFPADKISHFGLHAKHPDDFLLDLFEINSDEFIEAIKKDLGHYTAPKLTFDEYLASLDKAKVPKTAARLKSLRVLFT